MISEIIRGVTSGKIKPTKKNAIAFGFYEYPKSIKQAWEQFKAEKSWLKK